MEMRFQYGSLDFDPNFPGFHLLRGYNYLMAPRVPNSEDFFPKQPTLRDPITINPSNSPPQNPFVTYPHYNTVLTPDRLVPKSSSSISMFAHNYRKQRGEKKPIPEEQKDEKYFERRRRNNQAAKKSRDARKQREDQIALRATLLEHENTLLKAQLITVREEASSLRQLLLEKKSIEFSLK